MKWIEFSRLNQAVEYLTPTKKINLLAKEFKEIESIAHKMFFVEILSLDLTPNNLASKKAMKWLTSTLEVFEEELEYTIYTHGDIAEGVYHFDNIDESSEHLIESIWGHLIEDCSKSSGEAFRKFNTLFNELSSLERKWFLRFWLRTPRNGINEGTVRKMVAKVYDKKEAEVRKHMQLHSLSRIIGFYDKGEIPPNNLSVGRFVKPMLAKVVPREQWPKECIIEYKYDGARYQIHSTMLGFDKIKDGRTVIIFNRKGKVVTDKFPDIVKEVRSWRIQEPFIIDTEIYPVESDGSPAPFKKMGTRIHSKNIEEAVEKCPVKLGVFDCMMSGNLNLMDIPLRERLRFINQFPCQAVRTTVIEDDDVFYNLAINEGFEGIMIKDLNTPYESGKRSKGWAKHKPPRFDFDVVVTGVRYGEGKRANVFGSYDIAVKKDKEFIPIGSVGTGFSDMDLLTLTNQSKKLIQRVNNDTYELSPRIVLAVTCDLVTKDADNNLGLRFPRMIRIRDDKPVSEINTYSDIEAIGNW